MNQETLEENYAKWSIKKFIREISRWREAAHMAATNNDYEAYNRMLQPAESAFQDLHPRAYHNWQIAKGR